MTRIRVDTKSLGGPSRRRPLSTLGHGAEALRKRLSEKCFLLDIISTGGCYRCNPVNELRELNFQYEL
jgi:hypothetical protein